MPILSIEARSFANGQKMANAEISFDQMTIDAVQLTLQMQGRSAVGYGLGSIGRYASSSLMKERFLPRLATQKDQLFTNPQEGLADMDRAWHIMMANEKQGGHGERPAAVGLLQAALYDALAKWQGVPLWQLLAEQGGNKQPQPRCFVYASGGHFVGDRTDHLTREAQKAADRGFALYKIKIGRDAAVNHRRIEAVLASGLGLGQLAVDANGQLEAANGALPDGLAFIEEPAAALDYHQLAGFCTKNSIAVATGENLFSCADMVNLLRYGGLRPQQDWLQMDSLLSYGITEYLAMLEAAQAFGFGPDRFLPHAGHLFHLQAAAGLGLGGAELAIDDSSLFGLPKGWGEIEAGHMRLPDLPGVGFEQHQPIWSRLASLFAL
jgi:L-alanine-DL-glutamate epimerase-like enolase superfamily enzyme